MRKNLISRIGYRLLSTKVPPASPEVIASLKNPLIIDVRDPVEVEKGKGGPPASIPGSVNVPLNHNGISQKDHVTTLNEFAEKLKIAGVSLPRCKDGAIITHCGNGGRGGRAAALLVEMGFTNVHNGGGPSLIASALIKMSEEK
jgi:rhodanese-related sulfurtransferase